LHPSRHEHGVRAEHRATAAAGPRPTRPGVSIVDTCSWGLAEETQGAKDGVLVDPEYGGEVAGLRDAIAGLGFALLDRGSDRSSDLLVKRSRVSAVDRVERDHLVSVIDTSHETKRSPNCAAGRR
jgi:hypothetical protein